MKKHHKNSAYSSGMRGSEKPKTEASADPAAHGSADNVDKFPAHSSGMRGSEPSPGAAAYEGKPNGGGSPIPAKPPAGSLAAQASDVHSAGAVPGDLEQRTAAAYDSQADAMGNSLEEVAGIPGSKILQDNGDHVIAHIPKSSLGAKKSGLHNA